MWSQKQFTLPARSRGSYLITDTVLKELPELRSYKVGLLHLFIQHTSCALSLNENWDEVRSFLLVYFFRCRFGLSGSGIPGVWEFDYDVTGSKMLT